MMQNNAKLRRGPSGAALYCHFDSMIKRSRDSQVPTQILHPGSETILDAYNFKMAVVVDLRLSMALIMDFMMRTSAY
jgi:hypothetical protein